MPGVELALSTGDVFLIAIIVAIPFALLTFVLGARQALSQIGKGPLSIEQDLPQKSGGPAPAPVSGEVREAEVRQMVEAKAYRQAARGETPLDVEAEVKRLLDDRPAPSLAGDAGLREEVRQLVVARNERRQRKGEDPLDVEAEVERQLRELENLGQ
ncbi:MAG TPA: hypothetical protein VE401_07585 [Solirubrobacterales bacterium]|jgi:hypothetical protein|nr:hypothetical protein [Solirubrobacterales bacterium]